MKTRSAQVEAPNIAAIVKARHHARVLCPSGGSTFGTNQNTSFISNSYEYNEQNSCPITNSDVVPLVSGNPSCDEVRLSTDDKTSKSRSDGAPRLLKGTWSPDDRRLFFQAVRMYGRNFNEITRFIRSRGHRMGPDHQSNNVGSSTGVEHSLGSLTTGAHCNANASLSSVPPTSNMSSSLPVLGSLSGGSQTNIGSATNYAPISDLNAPCGGRTREQVRFFYQQTWHKIKRYVKFPEEIPQHVKEVYAIINYSVIRTRIKKSLDHRLGEKLNELVHCGTTVIKHNGRRFLLRTPVCQALKQLNNIFAPNHEFLLPEDVWIELVPKKQSDAWRVIEAEQNPRLRLRVDINRQLSDVITLVENKWQLAGERMQALLELPVTNEYHAPSILVSICPNQAFDGAIRLQEVPRIRPGDIGLRAYLDRMNAKIKRSHGPSVQPFTSAANINQAEQSQYILTKKDAGSLLNEKEQSIGQYQNINSTVSSSSGVTNSDMNVIQSTMINTTNSKCTDFTSQNNNINNNSHSNAELDLRELGKQLSTGVTREVARGIKVLTIYLALGCPDRIRFEYEFVCLKLNPSNSSQSASPYIGLIACQSTDPDGDGLSNGLRRLLHLNASDYLLHRDWTSRSVLPNVSVSTTVQSQKTQVSNPSTTCSRNVTLPPASVSQALKPTEVNVSESVTSLTPIVLPVSSLPQSIPTANLLGSVANTVVSSDVSTQPTVMLYPNSNTIQLVVNGTTSMIQLPSSLSSTTPVISPLVASNNQNIRPVTPTLSPRLVLLPQPIGQKIRIPVVERQLDHEKRVPMPCSDQLVLTKQINLAPKPANLVNPLFDKCTSTTTITTTSVVFSSPTPYVTSTINNSSASATSSLKSFRAFNARRRTTVMANVANNLNKTSLPQISQQSISTNNPHIPVISTGMANFQAPPVSTFTSQSTLAPSVPSNKIVSLPVQNIAVNTINTTNTTNTNNVYNSEPNNNNNNNNPPSYVILTLSSNSGHIWQSKPNETNLPQVHSVSSLNSQPQLQTSNLLSYINLNRETNSTDINMDELLGANDTNQSSLSALSHDTLASLLNTVCQQSLSNKSNQMIENTNNEQSNYLYETTNGSTNNLHYSCKLEDLDNKQNQNRLNLQTTDSIPAYRSNSLSVGDITLTDSMAAAVMDVHQMEVEQPSLALLDHNKSVNTPIDSSQTQQLREMTNLNESLPTLYGPHPECEDSNSSLNKSSNYPVNVEAFLRMITPNIDSTKLRVQPTHSNPLNPSDS